ncbi:MAG: hypothetical protein ACLRY6_11955 [[Clostridium] innocuum]
MHGQYDDGGYLRRQLGCRERHRLQAGGKSGNQYPYAVMMTGLLQKLPMSACDSPCV